MNPEVPQDPNTPHPTEPILEALLVNGSQKSDEVIQAIEALITQNEQNNPEPVLEASLVTQNKILEKIDGPQSIEIEVIGAETATITGPQGEKGDEPTDERLVSLIKPLIPEVKDGKNGKDGKDADEEAITKRVLGIVIPEIPTPEEVAALVPPGKNGRNGKDGKDAPVIEKEEIVREVLAKIPKVKDGRDGKDIDEKIVKTLQDKVDFAVGRASKTVSLVELDDVDLSELVKNEQGKYVLGGGSGSVDSVNGETGVVVLDTDDIADTATNRYTNDTDITRLANTSGTNTGDQDLSGYATSSDLSTGLAGKQPLDSDLTTIAGLTATTDNVIQSVAGAWASRTPAQVKATLSLVKADVGLSNVDNTSDATKNSASATLSNKTLAKPVMNGSVNAITADTDAATITFDMAASNVHTVTLGGNRTLALSNVSVGQVFMLRLQQDTSTRTVTWFSTIKWAGGTPPTLTLGASNNNKADLFGFLCTGSGAYDGFVIGQNI